MYHVQDTKVSAASSAMPAAQEEEEPEVGRGKE
jgi:hypothetical protein